MTATPLVSKLTTEVDGAHAATNSRIVITGIIRKSRDRISHLHQTMTPGSYRARRYELMDSVWQATVGSELQYGERVINFRYQFVTILL